MSKEDALRQLLDESRTALEFAKEHGQEKASVMLFAARTEQICLKGLGEDHGSTNTR